jgi:hypothetical protein
MALFPYKEILPVDDEHLWQQMNLHFFDTAIF